VCKKCAEHRGSRTPQPHGGSLRAKGCENASANGPGQRTHLRCEIAAGGFRPTAVVVGTACPAGGQCCLEIHPELRSEFSIPQHSALTITAKKRCFRRPRTVFCSLKLIWHAACYARVVEAVVCVVGPDIRINSAGVKGGEGQETRLFPLIWVRGPSGKLLPTHLLRQVVRWKGERPCAFPLSFCAAVSIAAHPRICWDAGHIRCLSR